MDQVKKRIIHLHRCRYMTRRRIKYLFSLDSTLKHIYTYTPLKLKELLKISIEKSTILHQDLHNTQLISQVKQDYNTFTILTIIDKEYPAMLKPIKDPPLVLYLMGDLTLLSVMPTISVIGTRSPSTEVNEKMKYIVTPLIKEKWVIVSGLARGIDSLAHKLTLAHNGRTIAVLGSGFNYMYPKENLCLLNEIKKTGLVISEYPPNTPPKPYHFPERNRIISGLSFGTLVIEATENSGTLITVDQALDQGREVYAIPGTPSIPQTKGCHKMIQDGAKLVSHVEDIKEDWMTTGTNWVRI